MKKIVNFIYSVYSWLVLCIMFFLAFFVSFFLSIGKKNKEYTYNKVSHYITFSFFKIIGISIQVYGQELVPKNESVIFISNHQSFLDINLLHSIIPVPFSFISKKEVLKTPIMGWHMKLSGHLPIDRENKKKSYLTLDRIIKKAQEKSIVIFPEGTRSSDGSLGNFKRGGMVAILKAARPVIPIAINGSHKVMSKGSLIFNFFDRKIKVKFGEPLYFDKGTVPKGTVPIHENERAKTLDIMSQSRQTMENLLKSIM